MSACREYQGARTAKGYGRRYIGQHRYQYLHRWVWEQINGPIPEGMLVLHRCDNPPCFLYEHLFLGTVQDNSIDMMSKGRGKGQFGSKDSCPQGHPYDDENTAINSRGHKVCRICRRENDRAYRARMN